MNEVEIWGVLSKEEFDSKLKAFEKKFGPAKIQKRLAIQILDADDRSLWTRIRITNGSAEIMQKVADWDDIRRQEISIKVAPNVEVVWKHFLVIKNLLRSRRYQIVIIQHENYIFDVDNYEVKLGHQFGKTSKYPFEIETRETESELLKFANELGLKPDLNKKGEKFWNKWNEIVNLDGAKMKDEKVKEIIRKYVKNV